MSWVQALPGIWAIILAVISVTVYAHTTFETKDEAEKAEGRLERRLERIENKLDLLVGNRNR